jgi:predicted nuclease with TOPRIM domain
VKLARAKEVPQCKAGRTGADLAEKVEENLKELLEHLQRTSVPMKLAVAR